ncbi:hypothetical protein OAK12_01355 [Alphaproteobacteria bacterium]|nr:hypothetical protein [Alphaproteobacteria bacterium]
MRFILITCFSLLLNVSALSDLIKPNTDIKPEEVIKIQLVALMNNDLPYQDAGISQTWEFAHPQNRKYTGPLSNFKTMMKSDSYSLMLNHTFHNIIFVSEQKNLANYFVELTDKVGNKFGFTWTVTKVLSDGKLKNCWMTSGVSQPLPLAKSA